MTSGDRRSRGGAVWSLLSRRLSSQEGRWLALLPRLATLLVCFAALVPVTQFDAAVDAPGRMLLMLLRDSNLLVVFAAVVLYVTAGVLEERRHPAWELLQLSQLGPRQLAVLSMAPPALVVLSAVALQLPLFVLAVGLGGVTIAEAAGGFLEVVAVAASLLLLAAAVASTRLHRLGWVALVAAVAAGLVLLVGDRVASVAASVLNADRPVVTGLMQLGNASTPQAPVAARVPPPLPSVDAPVFWVDSATVLALSGLLFAVCTRTVAKLPPRLPDATGTATPAAQRRTEIRSMARVGDNDFRRQPVAWRDYWLLCGGPQGMQSRYLWYLLGTFAVFLVICLASITVQKRSEAAFFVAPFVAATIVGGIGWPIEATRIAAASIRLEVETSNWSTLSLTLLSPAEILKQKRKGRRSVAHPPMVLLCLALGLASPVLLIGFFVTVPLLITYGLTLWVAVRAAEAFAAAGVQAAAGLAILTCGAIPVLMIGGWYAAALLSGPVPDVGFFAAIYGLWLVGIAAALLIGPALEKRTLRLLAERA